MFEQAFKNIDNALRKEAGCTTELDYTEQTSWLLFLKYLEGLEQEKATEAKLEGKKYSYILDKDYRWESWAAPKGKDGKLDHNKAMILAPANTPREIITRLHGELVKALAAPEVRDRIKSFGAEPVGNTPEQFAAQIRSDIAKWAKVAREAGIQPE